MNLERETIWSSSRNRQKTNTLLRQPKSLGQQDCLRLTFFGTFHVAIGEQTITDFKTSKVRALLAYLAIESDKTHERTSLAGLLWPDMPERSALRNLTQTLVRVRHAICDDEATSPFISASRQAVQFNRRSDYSLDVSDFAHPLLLCRDRRIVQPNGDGPIPQSTLEQVSHVEKAVALYQGELLAGFSLPDSEIFDDWLLQKRGYFHELAVRGMEQLAEFHMQAGNPEQAQFYAQRQLELDAWREKAHRQLMLAMAQNGHRAAAIAQYEKCREVLRYELDAEPDHATTILLHQIRAGEVSTHATQTITMPAVFTPQPLSQKSLPVSHSQATETISVGNLLNAQQPTHTYHHNIPQPPTALIGRDAILNEVIQSLRDPSCRLVTVSGRGGVGKTRLAQAVAQKVIHGHLEEAQRGVHAASANALEFVSSLEETSMALDIARPTFADGTWLVQYSHECTLAQSISKVLELTIPNDADINTHLIQGLAAREMLFILDNFECWMPEIDLLLTLIDKAPGISFLACSRERLNISHEKLFLLDTFPVPTSVNATDASEYSSIHLFAECTRQNMNQSSIDNEQRKNIVRICQLVDGLPLAIELAAMQTKHYDYSEIADALEQDLDFLVSAQRDAPTHHKSIRTVFDDSWNLLTAEEQSLLAKASIFAGPFGRDAILKITGSQLTELAALVDKSIISQHNGGRYHLPKLLRLFAAEKRSEKDHDEQLGPGLEDRTFLSEAFVSYYLSFAADAVERLGTTNQNSTLTAVQEEVENLKHAFLVAHDSPMFLDSPIMLWNVVDLFMTLGRWHEASKCIDKLHALSDTRLSRAYLLAQAAYALSAQKEYARALSLAEDSVRTAEPDDLYSKAWAHYGLGQVKLALGDLSAARTTLEDALGCAAEATIGGPSNTPFDIEKLQADCLVTLAIVAAEQRQPVDTEKFENRAFQLYLTTGDSLSRLRAQVELGAGLLRAKQYQKAELHLHQSLRDAQKIGSIYDQFKAHLQISQLEMALGRHENAQEHAQYAKATVPTDGGYVENCQLLLLLAQLAIAQEKQTDGLQHDRQQSLHLCRQAMLIVEEQENRAMQAYCKIHEGHALNALGRADEALAAFRDAAFLWKQEGLYHRVANTFVENAEAYLTKGDLASAKGQVDQMLKFIQYNSLTQLDDPLAALNISHKVLVACQDPRSSEVAALAQATLEEQKDQFPDPVAIDSFLENVVANREILARIR